MADAEHRDAEPEQPGIDEPGPPPDDGMRSGPSRSPRPRSRRCEVRRATDAAPHGIRALDERPAELSETTMPPTSGADVMRLQDPSPVARVADASTLWEDVGSGT